MGDIQFSRHYSEDNNCGIYWKTTKDFADGCSAHLSRAYYANTAMMLPDQGAFVIEHTLFGESVQFEANHHCK